MSVLQNMKKSTYLWLEMNASIQMATFRTLKERGKHSSQPRNGQVPRKRTTRNLMRISSTLINSSKNKKRRNWNHSKRHKFLSLKSARLRERRTSSRNC
jgi:hypothetical protein